MIKKYLKIAKWVLIFLVGLFTLGYINSKRFPRLDDGNTDRPIIDDDRNDGKTGMLQNDEIFDLSVHEVLARTIWGEGRSTDEYEQKLIAQVIINRKNSSKFPDMITDVVLSQNQFECWSNPTSSNDNRAKTRQRNMSGDSWTTAKLIARNALNGEYEDLIPSDTYYFVLKNPTKIADDGNKIIWAAGGYSFTYGMEIVEELDHYFLREV